MKNIILIAKREFKTQVKKKSFIILTLLTPLLIIGFGGVISLIFQANKSEHRINVIDKSGWVQGKLKSDEELIYTFVPAETEDSVKKILKETKEIDALLIFPKVGRVAEMENAVQLFTNQDIGMETRNRISDDVSEIIRNEKIKELGINLAEINDLDKKINLAVINILDEGKKQDGFLLGVKSGLSMLLMYMVFIFIMMYGIRVMRSVLEEKNSRVVEIIISSVKPFELMLGKIFGVTGVAMVQFSVWILMMVGAFKFLDSSNMNGIANMGENVQMIISVLGDLNYGMIFSVFVIYFILGYLFYSAMYAAIGAAVDNETETQQFTMLAVLPMLLAVYGSITIMNNPNGTMSFWLSMIPFTSPIAMLARIPFDVPVWQIALSMIILLISMLAMVFIASKIYRVGILMYGNKVTWKELWKWIKN